MDDPLKIAICEDTESEKEKLLEVLSECSIASDTYTFASAEELLKVYKPEEYDLILMDIYMDGMTGVEAVSEIRELDRDIPIAFITTSTDFALEGYRLSVLKYIEKPCKQEDIEDMLQLALMKREGAPSLLIQKQGTPAKIRVSKITHVEQKSRQVIIYKESGEEVQIYDHLTNMLDQLENYNFFYCHKSFAVNLAYVKYIDEELKSFVMVNGENIPIRRESLSKAKQLFEDFLFDHTRGV